MKTINNIEIKQLTVRTIEEISMSSIPDEKNLSVKISKEQHRKLKVIAFNTGTAMSEIVRSFLEQFLEQYHKENVIDGEPGCQD